MIRTYSGQRVQSNCLKANEIIARGDGGGNDSGPGRVVVDHLSSSPGTAVNSAGQKTSLVDLEPLESLCINASACVSGALGKVGQLVSCINELSYYYFFRNFFHCIIPVGHKDGAKLGSSTR